MSDPAIALVFTPEPWVEEVHRHFTDHGGVRVRALVIDPVVALEEDFDTLVVSHRWPGLTRALVDDLHDRRRHVLGIYDREEPPRCSCPWASISCSRPTPDRTASWRRWRSCVATSSTLTA